MTRLSLLFNGCKHRWGNSPDRHHTPWPLYVLSVCCLPFSALKSNIKRYVWPFDHSSQSHFCVMHCVCYALLCYAQCDTSVLCREFFFKIMQGVEQQQRGGGDVFHFKQQIFFRFFSPKRNVKKGKFSSDKSNGGFSNGGGPKLTPRPSPRPSLGDQFI